MYNYLLSISTVEPCPLGGYMANLTLDYNIAFTAYGTTRQDALEALTDILYELGDELC